MQIRYLLILVTSLLCIAKVNAQKGYAFEDSLFSYQLFADSILAGDHVNYDCSINAIYVTRKANNELIQTIIPPENYLFCDLPTDQVFIIEDINFDGFKDFRIVQFFPASPNIPYFYWLYDGKAQQFVRDTSLEEITSPDFNAADKVITSFWRASCCDHGLSTYKYINGKITLIEEVEIAQDLDNAQLQITTKKKLINGEMKLLERTEAKISEE